MQNVDIAAMNLRHVKIRLKKHFDKFHANVGSDLSPAIVSLEPSAPKQPKIHFSFDHFLLLSVTLIMFSENERLNSFV